MIKVSFSFGSEPMYVSDVWSPNLDLLDTQIGSCKYKNAQLTAADCLHEAQNLKNWKA